MPDAPGSGERRRPVRMPASRAHLVRMGSGSGAFVVLCDPAGRMMRMAPVALVGQPARCGPETARMLDVGAGPAKAPAPQEVAVAAAYGAHSPQGAPPDVAVPLLRIAAPAETSATSLAFIRGFLTGLPLALLGWAMLWWLLR